MKRRWPRLWARPGGRTCDHRGAQLRGADEHLPGDLGFADDGRAARVAMIPVPSGGAGNPGSLIMLPATRPRPTPDRYCLWGAARLRRWRSSSARADCSSTVARPEAPGHLGRRTGCACGISGVGHGYCRRPRRRLTLSYWDCSTNCFRRSRSALRRRASSAFSRLLSRRVAYVVHAIIRPITSTMIGKAIRPSS